MQIMLINIIILHMLSHENRILQYNLLATLFKYLCCFQVISSCCFYRISAYAVSSGFPHMLFTDQSIMLFYWDFRICSFFGISAYAVYRSEHHAVLLGFPHMLFLQDFCLCGFQIKTSCCFIGISA